MDGSGNRATSHQVVGSVTADSRAQGPGFPEAANSARRLRVRKDTTVPGKGGQRNQTENSHKGKVGNAKAEKCTGKGHHV